jgi:2-keto-3-deoxy-L-rhamnonate aldolase RhmA
MTYRLLENMEAKRLSMGMLTKGANPQMIRHLYAGGLDFVIVDMMHSKVGWDEAAQLSWVARADGLYPFIRIPSHPWGTGTKYVNRQFSVDAIRALSTCSEGVMWSISNFEEAELVSHMASDWHQGIPVTSSQQVTEVQAGGAKRRLLIPLIESLGALERIEDIMALDGISGVFIACTDLSHQLGHPHDYQHPKVEGAIRNATRCADAHNKVIVANTGYIYPTVDGQIDHAKWLADCGVDLVMLQTTEYYLFVISKMVSEGVRAKFGKEAAAR